MPPDRHPGATEDTAALTDLLASWPVALPDETRGYRPVDLHGTQPLAAADLGAGACVVVVGHGAGAPTALPCRLGERGWRVATAGDGVGAALMARAALSVPGLPAGFELLRLTPVSPGSDEERELGTDQSNMSVVVGGRAIVKWRSAPDADGRRSTRWRRHLESNGFERTPALLASLTWTDTRGECWALADVDAFLPDAEDGWDHAIAALSHRLVASPDRVDPDYAGVLGDLTAQLHAALLRPSPIIAEPTRAADPSDMAAMREGGARILERTLAIEATDQHLVTSRAERLRAAIDGMPTDTTLLGPIHGDLHIGQLVAWRGGLDVIDFDGAPEPTEPASSEDSPARDVAQMLCSLWNLAAAVDQRTDGAHSRRLATWASAAERVFLAAYEAGLAAAGTPALDTRMLEPLMAEQLCRELLYADATLPRWRYAPLQALRWRYPSRLGDDE